MHECHSYIIKARSIRVSLLDPITINESWCKVLQSETLQTSYIDFPNNLSCKGCKCTEISFDLGDKWIYQDGLEWEEVSDCRSIPLWSCRLRNSVSWPLLWPWAYDRYISLPQSWAYSKNDMWMVNLLAYTRTWISTIARSLTMECAQLNNGAHARFTSEHDFFVSHIIFNFFRFSCSRFLTWSFPLLYKT